MSAAVHLRRHTAAKPRRRGSVAPAKSKENPMSSGILQDKNAIVFGAGGSIGAAVAKEFASEGAQVFVAGRTRSSVEDLARQIAGAGGRAQAASVDALDDTAVNQYIDSLIKQTG